MTVQRGIIYINMKALLFSILLTFTASAQDTFKPSIDKIAHFGAGFTIGYVYTDIKLDDNNYSTFDYFASTQLLTMFAGMAKEGIDFSMRTGVFSWHDIAYNQLGALTGVATKLTIEKIKQYRTTKKQKLKL